MARGRKPSKIITKISVDSITCTMCGKTKNPDFFYQSFNPIHKTGKIPYCKTCLKDMCLDSKDKIDVSKFKQMLKLIDRPFIFDLFAASHKDKMDTVGGYIKNLAMPQYRLLGWNDSIVESQHPTENNDFFIVDDKVRDFFGDGYSNDEYTAMFKKYNFLKESYSEKTNLHTEALLKYIRYSVKEEMATSAGDAGAASSWAKMAKDAAVIAKINPNQLSAADLQGGLNSFGELIKAVEQAVDIIPILPRFKYSPSDAPDFIIWNFVNYIQGLKGVPLCDYKDIYSFYDRKKQEYINQYGDPHGIFIGDTTNNNRPKIEKFIIMPSDFEIEEGESDG